MCIPKRWKNPIVLSFADGGGGEDSFGGQEGGGYGGRGGGGDDDELGEDPFYPHFLML